VKIFLGPLLLDTPQRLLSLSLLKDECSRCLFFSQFRYLTPDIFESAPEIEKEENIKHIERRTLQAMKQKHQEEEKPPEERRTVGLGVKHVYKEEIRMKKKGMSTEKIDKVLRGKQKTNVDNTLFHIDNFDPYDNSVVDGFHLEVQGLMRTHFRLIVNEVYYGTIEDDLQRIVEETIFPNGSCPEYFDIEQSSGSETIDFLQISPIVLHKLLFQVEDLNRLYPNQNHKWELFES
jgi:hypothetical protein